MPRPLIGITTDYNDRLTQHALPYGYSTSVELAGGLPVLIPYRSDLSLIPEFVDQLDGILFSGGDDLDPSCFGEERHPECKAIDPLRERFERALLSEVEKRRLPTLGICLGSQLMNVHRGGSLIQFLPDHKREVEGAAIEAIEHRRMEDWRRRHDVKLIQGTSLAERLRLGDVIVNTSHKQAVRRVGRGLRVVATSPDGIIEGIEDPELPLFLGVQWHPERMHDQPEQLEIFKLLVERARSVR